MPKGGAKDRRGYAFVFIAGVIWGVIGPFIKVLDALGSSTELTSLMRVAFAFLIMLVITVAHEGPRSLIVDSHTLFSCTLLGILCQGVFNIFYTLAVKLTGVAISAVLLYVAPIVTFFYAIAFFGERPTRTKVLGIVACVLGCVLTVTNGRFDTLAFGVVGIACGVIAGVLYGFTSIIGRYSMGSTSGLVTSTWSFLFASIVLFLWLHPWTGGVYVTAPIVAMGFAYALIPTAIAYVFYYLGVGMISENSKVPVFASVETVVATILGIVLYHEQLGAVTIVGIVLILGSIAIMSRTKKPVET